VNYAGASASLSSHCFRTALTLSTGTMLSQAPEVSHYVQSSQRVYSVRGPHIAAAPARDEDANVPELAASKSGRQRRAGGWPGADVRRPRRSRGTRRAAHEHRPPSCWQIRYGLRLLAGADVPTAGTSGGGTSKAGIGVASSSARSRPSAAL
jgi:hypothetical protein